MRRPLLLSLFLLAPGFPGCAAVYVDAPVGEIPVALDPDEWDGTWIVDGNAVVFKVLDPEGGLIQLGWIESEEEGELTVGRALLHLREAGERMFATLESDESEEGWHYWALVIRTEENLLVLEPKVDRFRGLVQEGRLPGHVEGESGSDVYLTGMEPRHLNLILAEPVDALFDLDVLEVLMRLPR